MKKGICRRVKGGRASHVHAAGGARGAFHLLLGSAEPTGKSDGGMEEMLFQTGECSRHGFASVGKGYCGHARHGDGTLPLSWGKCRGEPPCRLENDIIIHREQFHGRAGG